MEVIYVIVGVAIGSFLAYLLLKNKVSVVKIENRSLRDQLAILKNDEEQYKSLAQEWQEERLELVSEQKVLRNQLLISKNDLSELQKHYEYEKAELKNRFNEWQELQKSQMDQQLRLIKEQISTASEDVLTKRVSQLSENNENQLKAILDPLKDKIAEMKTTVEKSDREQSNYMTRLDESIKANLKQAKEVGERADKLAAALMNENKTQGDFGELRLRTLLQNMGFEEGVQFEEQVILRDEIGQIHHDESGKKMIPDVILHFPDSRDVVIDSKMSLTAFENYYEAESKEAKDDALKRHLTSVRAHVKELANKNYSNYLKNGATLDFVMMYVFSESALQLALANDPGLWKEAYDQGVVITGSQSLYILLRVLEMTWRQVRQAENQKDIMRAADELVNKVQMFYERFLAVDDNLRRTVESFDKLKITTAPNGSSIVSSANKLLKFGAQENPKRKYKLPKSDDALELEDVS